MRPISLTAAAQPHLHVSGMGKLSSISANTVLDARPHYDFGALDNIPARAAHHFNPFGAAPDCPARHLCSNGARRFVLESEGVSVDQAHRRIPIHEVCRSAEGARSQQVIGRKQDEVV
jgi:hypothetical protein